MQILSSLEISLKTTGTHVDVHSLSLLVLYIMHDYISSSIHGGRAAKLQSNLRSSFLIFSNSLGHLAPLEAIQPLSGNIGYLKCTGARTMLDYLRTLLADDG